MLIAANLILNKPHNRLVNEIFFSKADRLRYLTPGLEEQIAEHRTNPNKYYREERKTLTVDTSENRFFKHVVRELYANFREIKSKLISMYSTKFTPEFTEELDTIEKKLNAIAHHPFFRQIGGFRGMKQESLVLQKASGYSTIFRDWIILRSGISFLEGVNRIELKNIAELYQIWCFLEIKNIIRDILGKEPEEIKLAEILVDGFTIRLQSGNFSRIEFKKETGEIIEIFHELQYNTGTTGEVLSHTVNQKPDIVVKITKKDLEYQFTYLFDAKYRIASDDNPAAPDHPPEDAINQMHRYRDAIYYQSADNRPKKEVIGAYVLFPGTNDEDISKDQYYYKSIDKVNIGAFPLLPGEKRKKNNSIIKNFLKEIILNKSSDMILREDVIPQKGMEYEDPDGLVFVGIVKSEGHKAYIKSGEANCSYIKVIGNKGLSRLNKIKYYAPWISGEGVSEFYECREIRIIPRKEILAGHETLRRNSDDLCYFFELGNKRTLLKTINPAGGNRVFRYTRLSELRRAASFKDFAGYSKPNEE